jgi:large subunit ribosomal protein L32e
MRRHIAAKGRMVKSGYGSPRETRGRHPCGLYETLVYNVNNLSTVEGKAIRIASSVGKRKRMEIRKRAEEMGLKVLN